MKSDLYKRIYSAVRKIPEGKVATYGDIALTLGNRRLSRIVGYALSCCTDASVPCHRVVDRNGRLAPGYKEQRSLLESEGIPVTDDHIELNRYRFSEIFMVVS